MTQVNQARLRLSPGLEQHRIHRHPSGIQAPPAQAAGLWLSGISAAIASTHGIEAQVSAPLNGQGLLTAAAPAARRWALSSVIFPSATCWWQHHQWRGDAPSWASS